jgi:tetratricopeptide (TPR) repeat protein
MINRRRLAGLGCILLLWAGAVGAADGEVAEAHVHFNRGLALVDAARFEEAVVEFQRAQAIRPHSSVLYNIAMAYASARRHALAIETFRAYLASSGEEQDSHRARSARARIEKLESSIAVLTLAVDPPDATVRIDGRLVHERDAILVDPGWHALSLQAEGFRAIEQSIQLVAGERTRLRLELEASPVAAAPKAAAAAQRPSHRHAATRPAFPAACQPIAGEPDAGQRRWLIISTAGAGLLLAGVTAGLVVDNRGRYQTWKQRQAELDRAWSSAGPTDELGPRQADNDDRAARIKLQDEVAVGAGVAGVALLMAASALWLSEPKKQRVAVQASALRRPRVALTLNW